jgi:acetylornithine deacetylase/succinyl-diaminopimelate desuccinylase-like protein
MERVLSVTWAGVPLVATMSTGATDGRYTRIAGIPTYGVSCMFFELNDSRAHGKDERVGVQDFYDGIEFNYQLMRELSSAR